MPDTHLSRPFEAYKGDQPYLFVSYAHRDAEQVFPIITAWEQQGYRIWYDEGIDPGNEWPEDIAAALAACAQFIVFVSPRAVESKNVRNEINYAINNDKPFLAIHLEETPLPGGLELRMGDIQAVLFHRMSDESFSLKMDAALLPLCRDPAAPAQTVAKKISYRPKQRRKLLRVVVPLLVAVVVAVLLLLFLSRPEQADVPQLARETAAMVSLYDKQQRPVYAGSGFVLSASGYIGTCYHAVKLAVEKGYTIKVAIPDRLRQKTAQLVYTNEQQDFAILKIPPVAKEPYTWLRPGDVERLKRSAALFTSCYDSRGKYRFDKGVVKRSLMIQGKQMLEITNPLYTGGSGGAVLNSKGELVGIAWGTAGRGENAFSYALAVNQFREIISRYVK